jgi:hypothetical protein
MNNSTNGSEVESVFSEEIFNIVRELTRENPNITTYDTFDEFINSNSRNQTRYSNNTNYANYANTNNNTTNAYDISNNLIFNVLNEYNVNILEYNINMREYIIRENNILNNTTEYSNNFGEYNNNISDYNSNMRRFLDLMTNINNNANIERIHNRNILRENRRHFVRPNTTHYRERTNNANRQSGIRGLYNYTPRQLLSYFWPNRTFNNVVVRPSERQITEATRNITYDENEEYNNVSCPITMEDFNNGEQVFQIKHCGHNFREDALRNWFRTNVRCPVCRYDIRDYTISDISGNIVNDLSGNIDMSNNETFTNRNRNTPNNENIDNSGNRTTPTNNRSRRLSSVDLSNAVNFSNFIENYVADNITHYVENINSNLAEFDVIFPIVYYTDTSGNYRYGNSNSSNNTTTQR